MKLAIAKILQRADVAAAFDTFHVAVFKNPFGWTPVHAGPLREILAVEERDRVGRRFAGLLLSRWRHGSDDGRLGTRAIVLDVIGIGLSLGGKCQKTNTCEEATPDENRKTNRKI